MNTAMAATTAAAATAATGVMSHDPVLIWGAACAAIAVAGWLFRRTMNEHDAKVQDLLKRMMEVERSNIRIEQQVLRFASDVESEKRTRAEVNREIFKKLDHLLERRVGDLDNHGREGRR